MPRSTDFAPLSSGNDADRRRALNNVWARWANIRDQSGADWAVTMRPMMDLVHLATRYEQQKVRQILAEPFAGTWPRHMEQPPVIEDPALNNKPWADNPRQPLEEGEVWNQGRRACVTGEVYPVIQGYPQNPYINYGVAGRGRIGRYGPNHAVDMAFCDLRPNGQGDLTLHILGIIRGDTGAPALCGGFVEFDRARDGSYPLDDHVILKSRVREVFEEMISGSVTLPPVWQEYVDRDVQKGGPYLPRQILAHYKWQFVNKVYPDFIARLLDHLARGTECYAGPVYASRRNTNQAWMETTVAWVPMSDAIWQDISRDTGLTFSAGDDARDVQWHEVTPDLLTRAQDHRALFCYVLGSFAVTQLEKNPILPPGLRNQIDQVVGFLQKVTKDKTCIPGESRGPELLG